MRTLILTVLKKTGPNFFVFLLVLMFIDYSGYGYYFFYLPLLYLLFHKGYQLVDVTFMFLLLWGIFYGVTNFTNFGYLNYASILMPIINFPFSYLMGKYVGYYNTKDNIINILFQLSLALAFISLISVFLDIDKNGFVRIDNVRNIPLIGYSLDSFNATNINSKMMPLVIFSIFVFFPIKFKKKILYVTCSFLVILCSVRLQSRTMILFFLFLFFIAFVVAWRAFDVKKKIAGLFIFVLFIVTIVYIILTFSQELTILNRLQNDDISSGGGRTELMIRVLENLKDYPLGGMNKEISIFAHNLWLDCARVAGIIPFLLLILISLKYVYNLFIYHFKVKDDFNLVLVITFISIALFIVFLVEPVLEGVYMCFTFFCFLFGTLLARINILKHIK